MKRETCIFYASWFEAIDTLPKAIQGEAYRAIMMYALRGAEAEEQGQMTKLIMAMVKPVIDTNNKRFENGCKGGRPQKEKPNHNQNETKTKPNHNQNETTSAFRLCENENENENENVNENESVCEKNAHALALAHAREFEIFQKFIAWCELHAPLANRFTEPLDFEQFKWLSRTYGGARCQQCAAELHNKEAYKKNRRAITAWKAFITKIS